MNLLELKQREQELFSALHEYSSDAEELFAALRVLMVDREAALSEMEQLQKTSNDELACGEQMILDDIRGGKVGLVDTTTGKPMTVALFARR